MPRIISTQSYNGVFLPYDEVSVKSGGVPPSNLYTDPGLETWGTFLTPDSWVDLNQYETYTYVPAQSTDAHTGTYSLRFTGAGTFETICYFSQGYALTPTLEYTPKIWAKGPTSTIYFLYVIFDMWNNAWDYNFSGPNIGTFTENTAQLNDNTSLETWDDANTPTGWTTGSMGGVNVVTQETSLVHTGAKAALMVADGTGAPNFMRRAFSGLTVGTRHYLKLFARGAVGDATPTLWVLFTNSDDSKIWNFNSQSWENYAGGEPPAGCYSPHSLTQSYVLQTAYVEPYTDGSISVYLVGGTAGASSTSIVDDISFKEEDTGNPGDTTLGSQEVTSSWTQYTLQSYTVPAGFTSGNTTFACTDNTTLIDDVELANTVNIFVNPSFEDWTLNYDNTPTYWQNLQNAPLYYLARETTIIHGGSCSASLVNTGILGSVYIGQLVTVTSGRTLTATAYLRGGNPAGDTCIVGIYNDDVTTQTPTQCWNFVLSQWDTVFPIPNADYQKHIDLTDSFVQDTITLTAPASGKVWIGYGNIYGNQQYLYVDDLSLIQSAESTALDIYNMTSAVNLFDLSQEDKIFSLKGADDNYAFLLTGDGSYTTNFSGGFGLNNHLYINSPGTATVLNPEVDSFTISLRSSLFDGVPSIQNWTIQNRVSTTPVGSFLEFSLNSGEVAHLNDNGTFYCNDIYLTAGASFGSIAAYRSAPIFDSDNQLVTKKYVDDSFGAGLSFDGGTADGSILQKTGTLTIGAVTGIPESLILYYQVLTAFVNTQSATHEYGESVTPTVLTWTFNRTGTRQSQLLHRGVTLLSSDASITNYQDDTALTETASYTIAATGDDSQYSILTSTVPFQWKYYYGVWDINDGFPTAAQILANFTAVFSDTRFQTLTFDASVSGPNNLLYVFPKVWGQTFLDTKINGISYTDWFNLDYDAFENASGGVTDYLMVGTTNQTSGSNIQWEFIS